MLYCALCVWFSGAAGAYDIMWCIAYMCVYVKDMF